METGQLPQITPVPILLRCLQKIDFPHKLGFCDLVFGRRLANLGIGWFPTASGIHWKLVLANPTHRWIVYGNYEGSAFHKWVRHFLHAKAIVVDSGANIGQMTLYLAQQIPNGKLLAFEPGSKQADWLSECLAVYQNLPVELIRKGLGRGNARLYLSDDAPSLIHGARSYVSEASGEPVEIVRLCDELAARCLTEVDLWKLDVEGHELAALEGAGSLLEHHRIRALYVEIVRENGCKIREYLKKFGYRCYLIGSGGKLRVTSHFPEHTNALFLPE